MKRVTVFNNHADEYDFWFEEHGLIYQAEIEAVRRFIPATGLGIEIGVGTGRFSIPFDIRIGIEPSLRMAKIASSRGIHVCQSVGEQLPFARESFDFALLVTVVCFVDDVATLLAETHRVLKPGGSVIIGFVDSSSELGRLYESRKAGHRFYSEAFFYSSAEMIELAEQAGFSAIQASQTIFGLPGEDPAIYQVREGYDEGAFVAIAAKKA